MIRVNGHPIDKLTLVKIPYFKWIESLTDCEVEIEHFTVLQAILQQDFSLVADYNINILLETIGLFDVNIPIEWRNSIADRLSDLSEQAINILKLNSLSHIHFIELSVHFVKNKVDISKLWKDFLAPNHHIIYLENARYLRNYWANGFIVKSEYSNQGLGISNRSTVIEVLPKRLELEDSYLEFDLCEYRIVSKVGLHIDRFKLPKQIFRDLFNDRHNFTLMCNSNGYILPINNGNNLEIYDKGKLIYKGESLNFVHSFEVQMSPDGSYITMLNSRLNDHEVLDVKNNMQSIDLKDVKAGFSTIFEFSTRDKLSKFIDNLF